MASLLDEAQNPASMTGPSESSAAKSTTVKCEPHSEKPQLANNSTSQTKVKSESRELKHTDTEEELASLGLTIKRETSHLDVNLAESRHSLEIVLRFAPLVPISHSRFAPTDSQPLAKKTETLSCHIWSSFGPDFPISSHYPSSDSNSNFASQNSRSLRFTFDRSQSPQSEPFEMSDPTTHDTTNDESWLARVKKQSWREFEVERLERDREVAQSLSDKAKIDIQNLEQQKEDLDVLIAEKKSQQDLSDSQVTLYDRELEVAQEDWDPRASLKRAFNGKYQPARKRASPQRRPSLRSYINLRWKTAFEFVDELNCFFEDEGEYPNFRRNPSPAPAANPPALHPSTSKLPETYFIYLPRPEVSYLQLGKLAPKGLTLDKIIFKRKLEHFAALGHTGIRYFESSADIDGHHVPIIARSFHDGNEEVKEYSCAQCPLVVFRSQKDSLQHTKCHPRAPGENQE